MYELSQEGKNKSNIIAIALEKDKTNRHKWTSEEDEILFRHHEEANVLELARLVGVTPSQVKYRLRILKLQKQSYLWTQSDTCELRRLIGTRTYSQVAKEMGKKTAEVKHISQGLGLTSNSENKWTESEVKYLQAHCDVETERLAKALGKKRGDVCVKLEAMGFPPVGTSSWMEHQDQELMTYRCQLTICDVAFRLIKTVDSVRKRIKFLGMKESDFLRSYREWSEREVQILENAILDGMKFSEIYKKYFAYRSFNSVQQKSKSLKLTAISFFWTHEEEVELKRLLREGKPFELIAAELGRTVSAVRGKAYKITQPGFRKAWTVDEIQYIKFYIDKKPIVDIARSLNRSYTSVRGKIKELKLIKKTVRENKQQGRWSVEEIQIVSESIDQNFSWEQIIDILPNRSTQAIYHRVRTIIRSRIDNVSSRAWIFLNMECLAFIFSCLMKVRVYYDIDSQKKHHGTSI